MRPRLLVVVLALSLLGAGVRVFAPGFTGPFIYDDFHAIPENATIRSLGASLRPPRNTPVAGRPVSNFTFAVNYALGGLDVRGYHAVNMALHIASSLLLFSLVRRTLEAPRLEGRYAGREIWLAWLIVLLWLVHPLQSEPVTYLIQRTELLAGLFYLLTLDAAARGLASARPQPWFALAVVACALGMGSKEIVASAPLAVLLYDRALVSGGFAAALRRHRGLYVGLGATWLVLLGLLLTAPRGESVGFDKAISPVQYLMTQAGVIVHYLRLTFWPATLSITYPWAPVTRLADAAAAGAVVVLLLAATLWALWRRPAPGFVGACFFLILAPTSSVLPIVTEVIAERRMYLPLACVVVLLVLAIDSLLARLRTPRLAVVALAALALPLGLRCATRVAEYRDPVALWRATAENFPHHPFAHLNLATLLARQGQSDEAIAGYRTAIALKHDMPVAHFNLGNALAQRGQFEEATEAYRQALRYRPDYLKAHLHLATALMRNGRADEAAAHYAQALRLDPGNALAHAELGAIRARQGDADTAYQHLQTAVELDPRNAEAHHNLARLLLQHGAAQRGVEHLRQVLHLRPQWPAALRLLAWVLATHSEAALRDGAEALAAATTAIKLVGDDEPLYLDTLAAAQAEMGQFEAAVQTAGKAQRLAAQAGNAALAADIQRRVELYRQRTPYRAGG